MAMTAAERRRKERERKRRQRSAARAAGKPTTAMVHAAIVEALSFEMSAGVNIGAGADVGQADGMDTMVDAARVTLVAGRILRRRHGIVREHAIAGVIAALAPRGEHRWPTHYPTHASPGDGWVPPGQGDGARQDMSASQS